MMVTLHEAASNTLDPSSLSNLRTFLDVAFGRDFTDADWAHAIGGFHIWLIGSAGVISHASLVERTLVCHGQTVRAGYVEAVATAPALRRRGHGTTVMQRIGELVRERYELGALSTGTPAFYQPLGWELWNGPTFVNGPRGRERTLDDDGSIMILRTKRSPPLDSNTEIVCEWRPGDVW